MDIQYYGGNCLVFSYKSKRVVVDDNLDSIGKKSVLKTGDVSLYTTRDVSDKVSRLVFNSPGEYEIGDISVVGIEAKAFTGDNERATMYKLSTADLDVLVTGHILDDLSVDQLEKIGNVDVLFIPVGDSGYTLDPIGALKLIKDIEPKVVVPTHYSQTGINYPVKQIDLASAIKEMAMEPSQSVSKLRLKRAELSELTQLIVLEAV